MYVLGTGTSMMVKVNNDFDTAVIMKRDHSEEIVFRQGVLSGSVVIGGLDLR